MRENLLLDLFILLNKKTCICVISLFYLRFAMVVIIKFINGSIVYTRHVLLITNSIAVYTYEIMCKQFYFSKKLILDASYEMS